jgi:hypothetical protein
VIPKGVKKIWPFAFSYCTSLTTVTLPVGVNDIACSVFFCCSALATIYVPAKKADYYKRRLPEDLRGKIVELEPEKKAKK